MKEKNLPENFDWSTLTIEQFNEIIRISDMKIDVTDQCIQILCVLTDNDEGYYLNMKVTDLQKEFRQLAFLTTSSFEPTTPSFKYGEYEILGQKYTLTPSAEHMTGGQFIDYKLVLDERPDDIAMLCATVLVPNGKSYSDGYDPLALREILYKNFTMAEASGISFFFQKAYEILYDSIVHYSSKHLLKQAKKIRNPIITGLIKISAKALTSIGYGTK